MSALVLGLTAAISTTGNRVLVVQEESAEKSKYSKFWGDLEGEFYWGLLSYMRPIIVSSLTWNALARGYKLAFESPKNDKLSLFQLGERAYDHVILLPPKSKGTYIHALPSKAGI